MTAVLEFDNVSASYDGAVILQGLTFGIEEGATVGLVGRNGAGKTTTLLSVFRVPHVTGEIRIEGHALGNKRWEPSSRGVSLVPQGKRILSNLTVRENLEVGRASRRKGVWTVEKIFELFPNLARGAKRPGNSLSGGEQQMLAIGRALMSEPKLLLLDEPTEGLAPVVIDELVEALKQIKSQGTSLLIVEQHIGLIEQLADSFIALRTGQLVGQGEVKQLRTREVQEMIAL